MLPVVGTRIRAKSGAIIVALGAIRGLVADCHGWDSFAEGDVFYMNDSYMTGKHLNDSTIIMPIFRNGQLIGFAASRAHWLDVGAKDPGSPVDSTEIFQEGMRWGPTRLYEGGRPRDDVIDLLRHFLDISARTYRAQYVIDTDMLTGIHTLPNLPPPRHYRQPQNTGVRSGGMPAVRG